MRQKQKTAAIRDKRGSHLRFSCLRVDVVCLRRRFPDENGIDAHHFCIAGDRPPRVLLKGEGWEPVALRYRQSLVGFVLFLRAILGKVRRKRQIFPSLFPLFFRLLCQVFVEFVDSLELFADFPFDAVAFF